jgi:hypothetical protein
MCICRGGADSMTLKLNAVAYPGGGVLRVLKHPPKAQRHARN